MGIDLNIPTDPKDRIATPTRMHIATRFHVVGYHQWVEAPEEVRYLRDLHRHVFGVNIEVQVSHDDRQVEFHMLKRDAQKLLARAYSQNEHGEFLFGQQSCEQIAEVLGRVLFHEGYRLVAIDVDEDEENVSRVFWRQS